MSDFSTCTEAANQLRVQQPLFHKLEQSPCKAKGSGSQSTAAGSTSNSNAGSHDERGRSNPLPHIVEKPTPRRRKSQTELRGNTSSPIQAPRKESLQESVCHSHERELNRLGLSPVKPALCWRKSPSAKTNQALLPSLEREEPALEPEDQLSGILTFAQDKEPQRLTLFKEKLCERNGICHSYRSQLEKAIAEFAKSEPPSRPCQDESGPNFFRAPAKGLWSPSLGEMFGLRLPQPSSEFLSSKELKTVLKCSATNGDSNQKNHATSEGFLRHETSPGKVTAEDDGLEAAFSRPRADQEFSVQQQATEGSPNDTFEIDYYSLFTEGLSEKLREEPISAFRYQPPGLKQALLQPKEKRKPSLLMSLEAPSEIQSPLTPARDQPIILQDLSNPPSMPSLNEWAPQNNHPSCSFAHRPASFSNFSPKGGNESYWSHAPQGPPVLESNYLNFQQPEFPEASNWNGVQEHQTQAPYVHEPQWRSNETQQWNEHGEPYGGFNPRFEHPQSQYMQHHQHQQHVPAQYY